MDKTAQRMTLTDGRTLAFAEYGPTTGLPVLWFHGAPSSRLEPLLIGEQVFDRLNLRVFSIDRPGVGLSDFQPGRRFSAWPADVVQLADKLSLNRFAVFGNSGGSAYVSACVASIPDRISSAVIVSGAWRMDSNEVKEGLPFVNRIFWMLASRFPIGLRILLRSMRGADGASREKELARMKPHIPPSDFAALQQEGRLEALQVCIRESLRQGTKGVAWDIRLYVRPINLDLQKNAIPIHLFHGVGDKNVPITLVRRMAEQIPSATLTEFPDDGHLSSLCCHFDQLADCLRSQR